jgi:hypothetical protein
MSNVVTNRTLAALDTVQGALGRGYMKTGDTREELLYAKNIEAKFEKKKTNFKVLGTLQDKHRAGGWSGSGSMNIYYCTSVFRQMAHKYATTGVDTYFDLVLENDDPGSNVGKQIILLKNVNIDDITLFMVDVDAEYLEEDVSFTFEGFEILQDFDPVAGE